MLYNGKIFTGEAEHSYAEPVASCGEEIVSVGNQGEGSKSLASGAERIDLRGNLLRPHFSARKL